MPCQALVILTVYTCLGVPASIIFGMHGGFQGVRLVRHLCTWHLVTWDLACVLGTWAPGHLARVPGTCAPGTWLVCLAPGTWHLGMWSPGHLAPGWCACTFAPGTWLVCLEPSWCAWHLVPGTWHLAPGWCAWPLGTWPWGTWAPGHLGTWHLGTSSQVTKNFTLTHACAQAH